MKNYSEKIGALYSNFKNLQAEMCEDALRLISKERNYTQIEPSSLPKLQKAIAALTELINCSDESPGARLTLLYLMVKAESFMVFPLSHLSLAAAHEIELLHGLLMDVEENLLGEE